MRRDLDVTLFAGRIPDSQSFGDRRSLLPVERPPQPLTTAEHRRLIEIVARAAPDLEPIARVAGNATWRWLTDEECDALAGVLLGVFLDHLDGDSEPDPYGVDADNLIGRIEMQRAKYWASP
jgi:hypothetical protein